MNHYKIVVAGSGYSTFEYPIDAYTLIEAIHEAVRVHNGREHLDKVTADAVISAIQWSK